MGRVVSAAGERMATVTLTEFLLARIAEDEAVARAGLVLETGAGYEPVAGSEGPISPWQRRLLAECEAKRRIVERCSAVGAGYPSHYLAQGMLAELAAVYADHPDWREEWRP